ncbi:MAG: hypothetical protein IKG72_08485 [Bacillus sp. (in: Bacteria)]|nr:hypothetical protein [Bacillus sp. (in: firmicutes)]
MNEQMIKQIRKYKCDNNMKKTDHGLRVIECRLKKEFFAGNNYANMYITISVPFYKASIKELVGWLRETFPELASNIDNVADIKLTDMNSTYSEKVDLELFQTFHTKADKNGNAPLFIVYRILKRLSFRGLEDINEVNLQKLFDDASLKDCNDGSDDASVSERVL